MSRSGTAGQDPWPSEERELRRREIYYTRWGLLVQTVAVLFALVGTAIAAYAAIQAREAARIAGRGAELVERQVNDDRLSIAISSIGGDLPAQRLAGFALLRRHIQIVVANADSAEERLDAYNVYTSALDMIENYLRSPLADEPAAGLGFGRPRIPHDNKYAARELASLMSLKPQVQKLWNSFEVKPPAPAVDLANVQLAEQSWTGIDFAWLGGHYFAGIDLRGANLTRSIWGTSWLDGAHLQCANLEGADLRGAHLQGADLRGAHLKSADFSGAQLDGVRFDGATGLQQAKGLPDSIRSKPGVSRAEDGIGEDGISACLDYEPYWEKTAATQGG